MIESAPMVVEALSEVGQRSAALLCNNWMCLFSTFITFMLPTEKACAGGGVYRSC